MNIDKVKEKLVYACRILALEGQGDHIWGHVTVRVPGRPELLFMKPATIGLEEIGPDDVITVNLDGEKVEGRLPRHIEVFIHTEVMRARPDVTAVVHTHPPHAVAFGALGRPLLPVGHDGAIFCDGLPVFSETTDLITDGARGEAVARTLGRHDGMLMRNHGIVTAADNIEEAVMKALFLERACKTQLLCEPCGGPRHVTPPDEAKVKQQRLLHESQVGAAFRYFVRRIGPLAREP
ncbi:MAG: class II aldolase/adducin family protein [Rhodospirillales bacterium]|nr:class II aldolase/adducin family protein [Rhodospirillales bacterium]